MAPTPASRGRSGAPSPGRSRGGRRGPTPPAGAPNVIVVLVRRPRASPTSGCYGSEIATPNIDRLAAAGLRFTDYHSTPMCSPTRASLLTGLNPHSAGVGTVAHSDPGFPGYAMEIAADVATAAEMLPRRRLLHAMVGKWHLTKDSDQHEGGSRHSWPCQRGFDRYYGFLDGFTEPPPPAPPGRGQPHRRGRPVPRRATTSPTTSPTGRWPWCRRPRRRTRPSPSSSTWPTAPSTPRSTPRPTDIARYRGRYDGGWDQLRQERFERMKVLGILPDDTILPPRNSEPGNDVAPWDDLDERTSGGWPRATWRSTPPWSPTSTRTSGGWWPRSRPWASSTTRSSSSPRTTAPPARARSMAPASYYVHLMAENDIEVDLARIDEMGGPTTTPHYPRGWAMAGNTPFRLYKINAHAGWAPGPLRRPRPGRWRRGRAAPPVPVRHRRAAHAARAVRPRSPGRVRRPSRAAHRTAPASSPLLRRPVGGDHAPRAVRRDDRPSGLLIAATGRRSRCTTR